MCVTMSKSVYVIGAGGHAKVVISTLQAAGYEVAAVFDDDEKKRDNVLLGVKVKGTIAKLENAPQLPAVLGIGDNRTRHRFVKLLPDVEWLSVVHPSAVIHSSVQVGCGTVVFAGVVIQPDTIIGAHGIVNTGATIDHDCRVGDFIHIAPGVHLAGEVELGDGTFIGIGGAIIPGIKVGRWSVIGAGSTVIRDVDENHVVVGTPARPIKS